MLKANLARFVSRELTTSAEEHAEGKKKKLFLGSQPVPKKLQK